jgi:glycosyltransferase involved in cell wall biosynthesis
MDDPVIIWAILTAEYPPAPGGVADYTRRLAHALAAAGDRVAVFAPDLPAADPPIHLHPLPDRFGPAARRLMTREFARQAVGARPIALLQWSPQPFGLRGMNLPLALWFARRPVRRWVMFHEVRLNLGWGQPPHHNLIAIAQRAMAFAIGRSSERLWVTIPGWRPLLRRVGVRGPAGWLPVPSNLPESADPDRVAEARRRRPWPGPTVAHFGTYAAFLADPLAAVLAPLLAAEPTAGAVLLGRGGDRFATDFGRRHPALASRVVGPGGQSAEQVAAELAAADLAVYPYPDGVSSRRTSVMAALALGVPVVTTTGVWTEPVWAGGVELAPGHDPSAAVAAARRLLADPAARVALGGRGRSLYANRFALPHTVAALRAAAHRTALP